MAGGKAQRSLKIFGTGLVLGMFRVFHAWAQNAPPPSDPQTRPHAAQAPPGTSAPQTGAPAMTDIIDIRPPESIWVAPELWQVLLFGAMTVVLLLLLLAGIWWWRKKRASRTETVPPQPPDVLALGRLNELAGRADMSVKRYYFNLSAILRRYIEGRFGVEAMEMTAEELTPRLEQLDLAQSLEQDVRRFIKSSDLIKFAKQGADTDQMTSDTALVKGFVINTPMVTETPDSASTESDPPRPQRHHDPGGGSATYEPGNLETRKR